MGMKEKGKGKGKDLFGMVKALEVVFAEKSTILGLSAARHALTKIHPEIDPPSPSVTVNYQTTSLLHY
ncbi:hypothetical protein CR513_00577, partial [Mucuna pruriens]